MKNKSRLAILVLVLILLNVVTLGVTLTSAQSGAARTAVNSRTGKLSYLGATVANPIIVPAAMAEGLSTEARAAAILNIYAPQFGAQAQDLVATRELAASGGRTSRRYQQYYQGIPVFGAEVVVNLTRNGGLVSMLGKLSPDLAVGTIPLVTAAQAQQTALQLTARNYSVSAASLGSGTAALWIYDERLLTASDRAAALVWRVEVVSTVGAPVKTVTLVNAVNGNIMLAYNKIDTHWTPQSSSATAPVEAAPRALGSPDMATYDANNTVSLPGTFVCDESAVGATACTGGADTDADAAHYYAAGTYDMYADWHNRDSLNGAGFQLISTVHFDSGYCNAFWNSAQMAYGDGCSGSIVIDDVVSHELTHGVTEFTSNLVYAYQSGAINESFSDVWGEFFDLTNLNGDEAPETRWMIGEELDFGGPQNGIRDMQDPTIFGDPDRMQSPNYYLGSADNGGVHWNSGVNNKAAYLLVDGDTFNGVTVVGIGIDKAAQIYYDTQTTKLISSSDYLDLYNALQQSCTELIGTAGITAEDCTSVTGAVTATEMNLEPGEPAPTADVCETGTPNYLFNDGLESGGANWVSGAAQGANAWTIADTTDPLVGTASNYGANLDSTSLSSAAMVADVAVPADAYLHFEHKFGFELFGTSYYDGGILEYSTNGGSTWTQVPSAGYFQEGLDYGGAISSSFENPLGGKQAFVGGSGGGIASTRYTLTSLSGQSVRFRWSIGSDEIFGADGWRVDNIKIYTCDGVATEVPTEGPTSVATEAPTEVGTEVATEVPTEIPSGTEVIENGGFELKTAEDKPDLTPWTIKNLSADKVKCNKEGKTYSHTGECAFVFKGGAGELATLQQVPDLTGLTPAADDTLDFSVFVKATNAAASGKIKVVVKYGDETPSDKINLTIASNTDYSELTGSITLASADVTKVKVQIKHNSPAGKVFVDDVSLIHDTPAAVIPLPSGLGTR